MPRSGCYNWLCVVNSLARLANDVATIRAAQIGSVTSQSHPVTKAVGRNYEVRKVDTTISEEKGLKQTPSSRHKGQEIVDELPKAQPAPLPSSPSTKTSETLKLPASSTAEPAPTNPVHTLGTSAVPSSKIARLFHYGGLALSLAGGNASSYFRSSSDGSQRPRTLSEANINRLVEKLSRMRGAALKLGQFMSIQDTHMLPPELDKVFRRVQNSAHYMPHWQMEKVMKASLGQNYLSYFCTFNPIPFAAASIGQVHAAQLNAKASPTGRVEDVVVKIQFPGIDQSIESDLGLLKSLLIAFIFLPRGLFLDRTIAAMRAELKEECDYKREGVAMNSFRGHLSSATDSGRYRVPWVWNSSTRDVLVMERLYGTALGEDSIKNAEQLTRNKIGNRVVELCLRELFEWRTMQTDPNWSNFQWDSDKQQLQLLDFGATRYYEESFMIKWYQLLQAAIDEDREGCVHWSKMLGYLTGEESEVMLNSHVDSMILLASPFRHEFEQPYAFGSDTAWSDISERIRAMIPVMLRERLTPPPRETYSLNRKLSGTFLLASRLQARVDCRQLWHDVAQQKYLRRSII